MKTDKTEPVHKFSFTPGERMVFYRWRNKYQPTENYQNLFNQPWCPLFGVLPFDDPSETTVGTCKDLIKKYRTFLGIPSHLSDYCPEAYPDPKVIFQLTGFPQAKLKSFRSSFGQWMAENDEPTLSRTKQDFRTPLMRIAYIWALLKNYYSNALISKPIRDEIFRKPLRSAEKDMLKDAEDQRCHLLTKDQVHGKKGYPEGIGKRHQKVHDEHKEDQRIADRIWAKHPDWDKKRVAIKIAKETGGNFNTIRRRIKKK